MKWDKVRLGDVLDYENKSKIKAGDGLQIGKFPFYTSSNELSKYLDEYLFDKTSLIFGTGGNASIHYCDIPFAVSTDCLVAFAIDNNKIDTKFVYYYISGNIHLLEEGFKGAGLKHISKGYINDLQIPLPPLPIQKRIAQILDAADALKRKDQQLLKKYDELAQAIFIDMFGDPVKNEEGWDVIELERLCLDIADCPHTTPIHINEVTNYPCIRTSEMKNGKIVWDKMKYLDYENYLVRIKRLVPQAGDIVYAREGTYGEAVILPDGFKFGLGQRTMLFRPDSNKCDSFFIWYFINSDYVYQQAKRKNMGSTVGHVNVADVKKFKIMLPPIELQKKFGDTLKIINNLSESFNRKLFSFDLFNSLIQKAFNGQLTHE